MKKINNDFSIKAISPIDGRYSSQINEEINNINEILDTINNTLEKHEKIKKIIVLKDSWSIENNILTPTLKIKRASIEKKYKEFYDYWYKSEERILFQ